MEEKKDNISGMAAIDLIKEQIAARKYEREQYRAKLAVIDGEIMSLEDIQFRIAGLPSS